MLNEYLYRDFSEKYNFYLPPVLKSFFSTPDLESFLQSRFRFFYHREEPFHLKVEKSQNLYSWQIESSTLELVMPDIPFIVDTIVDYLASRNITILTIIQPVFQISRDGSGNLQQIDYVSSVSEKRETHLYLEMSLSDSLTDENISTMYNELTGILKELIIIVNDFPTMAQNIRSIPFENEEYKKDVEMIMRGFVFLGLTDFSASGLGIFHQQKNTQLVEDLKVNFSSGESINFIQTGLKSLVDRQRTIYAILFQGGDRRLLLAGHFTRRLEMTPRSDVPFLARKLNEITVALKLYPTSHMHRELLNLALLFPVGFLASRKTDLFLSWMEKIFESLYTGEIDFLFTLESEYQQIWALAIIPDRDLELMDRTRWERILGATSARWNSEYRISHNDHTVFLISLSTGPAPETTLKELEMAGTHLFTTWRSHLRQLLESRFGSTLTREEMQLILRNIPAELELHQSPEETIHDFTFLQSLLSTQATPGEKSRNVDVSDRFSVWINEIRAGSSKIKIASQSETSLSDLIPTITRAGFIVEGEYGYTWSRNGDRLYIIVLKVVSESLRDEDAGRIAAVVSSCLNHRLSDDIFNAATVQARLTLREINLFKSFSAYLFQYDKSYSRVALHQTLMKYPSFIRSLLSLFRTIHDPAQGSQNQWEAQNQKVEASYLQMKTAQDEAICRI